MGISSVGCVISQINLGFLWSCICVLKAVNDFLLAV